VRDCVVDDDVAVEVRVEATVEWVELGSATTVVGVMVVGATVGSAGLLVTAAWFVAPSWLLVRASAHPIPATVTRTTSTSGASRR
jgi:hypothetical protein